MSNGPPPRAARSLKEGWFPFVARFPKTNSSSNACNHVWSRSSSRRPRSTPARRRQSRKASRLAREHDQLLQEQSAAEAEGARLFEAQEDLGRRIREAERAVEQSRQALLASIGRAAELRNQLVQAEEMALALDRQRARIADERGQVEAERRQQAAELDLLAQENERLQSELARLAESVSQTATALDVAQKDEIAERRNLENLRRELSGMQARKQALE